PPRCTCRRRTPVTCRPSATTPRTRSTCRRRDTDVTHEEGTMTAAGQHPRRLDDGEMATWLPVIRFVQLLPQVLDRTLKEEVGLNHARYAILVTLAGQGEGTVTMTELARIAGLSRSRLSHALDSLEERGWVERASCGADKRTLSAAL